VEAETSRERAQVSIELVTYVGLFSLAISAAALLVYPHWETQRRVNTAELTVADLRSVADAVYSSEPGRRQTITINVPSGVIWTSVDNHIINMALELPRDGITEVIEITKAPVKGNIPKEEGLHKVTVEYMSTGYVVLGSHLSMSPAYQLLETTAENSSNYTITLENTGDKSLTGISFIVDADNGWSIYFD
jgi:hypothetical protein